MLGTGLCWNVWLATACESANRYTQQAIMMRQQAFSRAGNRHCLKSHTDECCPCLGLGVGVGSAIACDWIGQQITQRANYVKIGKNRDNKEMGDGCLAGVRKQGRVEGCV